MKYLKIVTQRTLRTLAILLGLDLWVSRWIATRATRNGTVLERLKRTRIIQGGMGMWVSRWQLARRVAMFGQAGTVSGTGLAIVITRLLQNGDPDGSIRRALNHFPIPEMGEKIWDRYYIKGGKRWDRPYKSIPMIDHNPGKFAQELLIVANFVEVWLAKEGHDGLIGVNYLEKIQPPHLYSLFGAMLARVDYVIIGAGLAYQFPQAIEDLWQFMAAKYLIDVKPGKTTGLPSTFEMTFDPATVMSAEDFHKLKIQKPLCLFIVSTALAAKGLIRKTRDHILPDGFIIESNKAGGHNAPPRGEVILDEEGQPIYDEEGEDNLGINEIKALTINKDGEKIELNLPFWLAGEINCPERLKEAIGLGACGGQVGTAFSFCEESGITAQLKHRSIRDVLKGTYRVFTSIIASPTKFPFKTVVREGTLTELKVYQKRDRICDLGYLREAYWYIDGDEVAQIGWRCCSEPIDDYLNKGGKIEDTEGSMCLCNALTETVGLGQIRKDGRREPPVITSGDNTTFVSILLRRNKVRLFLGAWTPWGLARLITKLSRKELNTIHAEEVVDYILDAT